MTIYRRHYAYARHALVTAFSLVGVRAGARVLVPDFICRDLLASFSAANVEPMFYAIGDDLQPKVSATLPPAAAIVVVNYFGFPADLRRVAAMIPIQTPIIEDNAHGWLSADADGTPLGSRTTVGITSVRKTIRVPDGAFVEWDSAADVFAEGIHPELAARDEALSWSFRLRQGVATLDARSPVALMAGARHIVRSARRLTGQAAVSEDERDEWQLPTQRAPHRTSLEMMSRLDIPAEVRRRRELFARCANAAVETGVVSPTPSLDINVSPQGFAFFGDIGDVKTFSQRVVRERLGEIITWPSLPERSPLPAQSRLRTLRLVNFLV